MLMELLPAGLWCIAMVLSINICIVCVIRSRYGHGKHPTVRPVSWGIIGLHVVSLAMAMLPYLVFLGIQDGYAADIRGFYMNVGLPSAVLIFLTIALQLVLMYLQARRAVFTQMDEHLRRAGNAGKGFNH